MKTVWLEGLKDQERKDFKEYLQANKKLLDKLTEICYNMYRESEKASFDYETPSWPYHQAHLNGVKETLKKVIDICDIANKE